MACLFALSMLDDSSIYKISASRPNKGLLLEMFLFRTGTGLARPGATMKGPPSARTFDTM